jgi:hypothetical protein
VPLRPANSEVAEVLERVAGLLEAQGANRFRIRAYRRAAAAIRDTTQPVRALLEEGGAAALQQIPGVGPGIASAVRELVFTRRLGMLERLEGEVSPEDLFARVPGIGEKLARRIHAALGIETLEELELAAHDGRLERVEGIGARRVHAIRNSLAAMLAPSVRRHARRVMEQAQLIPSRPLPPLAHLLSVDEEYRRKAARNELKRIAPRRFNPAGEAWLPVLHTERAGWHFTALFSNTATAHELGKTRDWVVLFYDRDGDEDQVTVVTEHGGVLAGKRVVRGREVECAQFYRSDFGRS